MYGSGAKFEEDYYNVSGDILDSVFYCLSEAIYYVITFPQLHNKKREYL